MYVVTEADAAAIRTAYEAGGELSAAMSCFSGSRASRDNAKGVSRRGSSLGGRRCRNAEHGAAKGKRIPLRQGSPWPQLDFPDQKLSDERVDFLRFSMNHPVPGTRDQLDLQIGHNSLKPAEIAGQ